MDDGPLPVANTPASPPAGPDFQVQTTPRRATRTALLQHGRPQFVRTGRCPQCGRRSRLRWQFKQEGHRDPVTLLTVWEDLSTWELACPCGWVGLVPNEQVQVADQVGTGEGTTRTGLAP